MVVVRFLYLLAVGVWVGSICFFSFVAAPTAFRVLPREEAGKAVGAMFPKYYGLGVICGVVALATGVFAVGLGEWVGRAALLRLILLGLMLAGTLYAGYVLLPKAEGVQQQIAALGSPPPEDHPLRVRFAQLHRRSVQLNAGVLVLGLAVVLLTARTVPS
ncbi:MAG: DUF4149 domain-containing protein [Deltaproteobacteria bacterium]|nr:DUF4149 domain-containing protein [Deltaproteobacteria bacterium]MBI3075532.1 DUF4149 domain-containing protein [Deltaproteobacteria bacterium]